MAGQLAQSELSAGADQRLRFALATDADDPALRRLVRDNPLAGAIQVTLEREPNFFSAAAVEGRAHYTVAVRAAATGEVVAMGSRSVRPAFVNGQPVALGYLSQLRVDRAARARTRPVLRGGYALLRQTHRSDETPFDLTTIVADNHPARRLLEAGLPGLPRYHRLEEFVTFLLPVRRWVRAGKPKLAVATGTAQLLPGLLACLERFGSRHQFAPRWTVADLRQPGLRPENFRAVLAGNRVRGCLALWDQRTFKQVVVRGYDATLARWRPLLNLLGADLPRVGESLAQACLSHLAIDDDDPAVLAALVDAALAEARRTALQSLILGFAARHPLTVLIRRRYRCREYVSILYAVHWDDLPALDARIPHPEVALL